MQVIASNESVNVKQREVGVVVAQHERRRVIGGGGGCSHMRNSQFL